MLLNNTFALSILEVLALFAFDYTRLFSRATKTSVVPLSNRESKRSEFANRNCTVAFFFSFLEVVIKYSVTLPAFDT